MSAFPTHRSARAVMLAAFFAVLAAACGPGGPTAPGAPAGGKPPTDDKARSEIEFQLARRAESLARGNRQVFESTIDMARGGAFRRCQLELLDQAQRRGYHSDVSRRVLKLEPFLDKYVRAYVDEGRLGVARRYFRKEGDKWLLTEPKASELGGEKAKVVDGLELTYFAVDEDLIDILAKEGLRTREEMLKLAKKPTRVPFALRFFPTLDSIGYLASCQALATSSSDDQKLRFYGIWLSSDLRGVSDDMRNTFLHEALHWLQDQQQKGITARLDWWLLEGWPDYVSGLRRGTTMHRLLCEEKKQFTFKQMADGFRGTGDELPPETGGQYYAQANAMIEYLLLTYGKDKYWDLLDIYVERVEPSYTYPKVLGVTPEKFYADWLAWAQKDFCEIKRR